jgi:hypothetical protein
LFGGFASTICWPLSALLVEHAGWRGTCLSYAAVQIAFALPVHLVVLPRGSSIGSVGAQAAANHQVRLDGQDQLIFLLLASSLTIAAGILSIIGTHLLPTLLARGMDVSAAVALGAIVSQVGARTSEALAGHRYHPVWTMVASGVMVAAQHGCWPLICRSWPLRSSSTAPAPASAGWRAERFRSLCSVPIAIRCSWPPCAPVACGDGGGAVCRRLGVRKAWRRRHTGPFSRLRNGERGRGRNPAYCHLARVRLLSGCRTCDLAFHSVAGQDNRSG